jgi:hypothetical protein
MSRTFRLVVVAVSFGLFLGAAPAHASEECVEVGQVKHCLS